MAPLAHESESESAERPPVRRRLPVRVLRGCVGSAAFLLLFVVSAVLVCRAAGTDGVTPVPQLLAALPWLAVPAAGGLFAAAALRVRSGALWAVAVLAVVAWYARPFAGGYPTPEPPGPVVARLTVLTSNVEFGQATQGLIDEVMRESARGHRPDLVFVEECSLRCSALLDARLPHALYPYRDVVREDGSKGSAILSLHPLDVGPRITSTMAMPGALMRIGGRTVRLRLAHPLPPIPGQVGAWRAELGRIADDAAAGRDGPPAIVAGDFNATRDHAAFRDLLTAGGLRDSALYGGAAHTPSWPHGVPRPLGAQIDHVLTSREFAVRDARFIDLSDTDHRALRVRLDLHEAR
ncbi:endonuclease/exonuclease/phosphatase family protein [Streptomyces fuscigenes]|uniref:endonuclease/exonuclease/phosphatase family protein n=1 Tax=Streptomyces fuscigenes TaxID=1528880 RepID=UPI001F48A705|nr:endonuclease/exonuclease/phosphatase family protein [Streptomyces fuscigenes]MCF3961825.1 endonuclease/exonuclease/phosphatase family protein [Streptomyces fuscigenes]